MCLGIPGEIVEILDADAGLATVEVSGVRRAVSIKLLEPEPVSVGDWVLVHVGFALATIDADEAAATLDQIKRLGTPFRDEMDAFATTDVDCRDIPTKRAVFGAFSGNISTVNEAGAA